VHDDTLTHSYTIGGQKGEEKEKQQQQQQQQQLARKVCIFR
jgi:hypothetical protein